MSRNFTSYPMKLTRPLLGPVFTIFLYLYTVLSPHIIWIFTHYIEVVILSTLDDVYKIFFCQIFCICHGGNFFIGHLFVIALFFRLQSVSCYLPITVLLFVFPLITSMYQLLSAKCVNNCIIIFLSTDTACIMLSTKLSIYYYCLSTDYNMSHIFFITVLIILYLSITTCIYLKWLLHCYLCTHW